MAQSAQLKIRGLYTFPNHLSEVPEGALQEAINIIIDRDSVAEPRRGLKLFGDTFGTSNDRAKQILTYKDRALVHYDNKLAYDSDGSGTFLDFAGTYTEADAEVRTKYIEQNGNLFFTTDEGIKKISAVTTSDFTTAAGFILDAGGIKALDIDSAVANYNTTGFFTALSKVAYKVVWNIVDNNENLIAGAPSARIVVENVSTIDSATVDLEFSVPEPIQTSGNTDYFYQVYRTAVFTAPTLNDLDLIDPGVEMNLVIEDFYDGSSTTISVNDITSEDLRAGGALLYTNPVSGEGISQANDAPPFAKDIEVYKEHTFYSNTSTVQRLNIDLLSIVGVSGGVSPNSISISDGVTTRTYTFRGSPANYSIQFSAYNTKSDLDGKYLTLISANDERTYKIWFDDTGTTTEPTVVGATGIRVDTTAATDTADGILQEIQSALEANSIDFTTSFSSPFLNVTCSNNGEVTGTPTHNTAGATTLVVTKLFAGTGEDVAGGFIFLARVPPLGEVGPTTAQQIDQTARSIVRVINGDTSGLVNAYYESGSTDIPGKIRLEQRDLTGPAFYVYGDEVLTASKFNPTLGDSVTGNETQVTSSNEVKPNRIYYSKYQQPEAVPLSNYFDVGPKDKAIQRIVSLRDSLFIFKEDAIYRLTGDSAPFQVSLFDSSAVLIAPDSAVVLNNLVYCFSSQGIITVSDTGVQVISRPIENQLLNIIKSGYSYETASFGVSYETDRAYMLWTVTDADDTVATQCFRYNTFTRTWTKWDISARCGLVLEPIDRLYIGATDINNIEEERKSRDYTDYADREYNVSVVADEVNGAIVEISSVANAEVGDVLLQTQYLTIADFNALINQLDADASLPDDYETLLASAGDSLTAALTLLVTKLNTDDTSHITQTFGTGDVDAGTETITITSHGFTDNDIVYFTNATLPGGLSEDTKYYIINSTPNTFQVSLTLGGGAVDITSTGSGTHSVSSDYHFSGTTDFETMQTEFNDIAEKLEASSGVSGSSFVRSTGTTDFEDSIIAVDDLNTTVTLNSSLDLIAGTSTLFKAIISTITWDHEYFQDPSVSKQVSEGTIIVEDNDFTEAVVTYSTDLSPSFDGDTFISTSEIDSGKPYRTYPPRNKQRCRWMSPKFVHSIAREKYSILGMSLTYRYISQRSYK